MGKNTQSKKKIQNSFSVLFFFHGLVAVVQLTDMNIKACVDFTVHVLFLHARIGFTKNSDINHTIYFERPNENAHMLNTVNISG